MACPTIMASSTIKVVSDYISEISPVTAEMSKLEDGEFQLVNNQPKVAHNLHLWTSF